MLLPSMTNNNAPTFYIGGVLDTNYSYGSYEYFAHPQYATDSVGNVYIAGTNFKTKIHEVSSYDINGLLNNTTVDLSNLPSEISNKLQVGVSKTSLIQANGKQLIATRDSISRLNSNDSIDTSFGQGGIIPAYFSPLDDKLEPRKILVSNNNEILVLSEYGFNDFVLLRYTSDGALDSTFNQTGYLKLDYIKHVSFDIQNDGKILIYGKDQKYDATITRIKSNATIDNSFAINGLIDLSVIEKELPDNNIVSLWADSIYDTAEQADGKILVAGTGFIARLNQDGALDESFGFGGINAIGGVSVQEDANHQILLATRYGFLIKLNSNGQLDKDWASASTVENTVIYESHPHSEDWVNLSQSAEIFDADLAALDGFAGNYNGVSIIIQRKGGAVETDEFSLGHFGQVIGNQINYNGQYIGNIQVENGRLEINIKEDVSQQIINYLLQSISYKNETPYARDTTISFVWTFSDGNDGSQGVGGNLTTSATSHVTIKPYLYWQGDSNVQEYLTNNSISLSVQGDHTKFEAYEDTFDAFNFSRFDYDLNFTEYLHDAPLYTYNVISYTNDVFIAEFLDGNLFTVKGKNLTQDNFTIYSYNYQTSDGLNFLTNGEINYSPTAVLGTFSSLTVTDSRKANSTITHHYLGEISSLNGTGTYNQYTVSQAGFSATYKGEMSFDEINYHYDSITYELGNNKLTISNIPQGSDLQNFDSYANLFHTITNHSNLINGSNLNDFIEAGNGNDTIFGGSGFDTVYFNIESNAVSSIRNTKKSGTVINSSEGIDTLFDVESLAFKDGVFTRKELLSVSIPSFSVSKNGISSEINPTLYDGAVSFLEYQLFGGDENDIIIASVNNDFINLLGGDDAANGGAGDDVLDGGNGSNFLTGGGGDDTFFLDGRSSNTTWSTVTDFSADEINIWGWVEGTSKLLIIEESAGAKGFQGATYHYDLNNDGEIETSITFSGLSVDELPTSSAHTIEENGYLLFS